MPTAVPETRWARRKQARPAEILDAALKVFAHKGFAAARMDDIAKEAGVTKGTIYLYFESKEAVFKSLVRAAVGSTLDTVSLDLKTFQGSTQFLLRMVFARIVQMLVESNKVVLPKIVISESSNFPWLAEFYRFEIIERGLHIFTSLLERGMAQGEFRKLPAQHVARLCVAPVLLGAIWRVTFGHLDTEPYDYKGLVDTHLDILFRGLAAEERAP
jgi:AcrR family transcriptional regulator